MKKFLAIILTTLIGVTSAYAQVTVKGRLDSLHIAIGDQIGLSIDVTASAQTNVNFPELKEEQEIVPGVEIVEIIDDTVNSGKNRTVTRKYQLTSFDAANYTIPAQTVNVGGKDYKTKPLKFKVSDIYIDTLKVDSFNFEKGVMDVPFSWSEDWSHIFWMSCLSILLLFIALYLYIRRKQNKPIISRTIIIKHIPPHQKALKAIDKIKEDRTFAADDPKLYYTQLTDTLRKYIEERFGFSAMEMTTTEIIEHLRQTSDQTMIDELHELFETADLVKFAKHSTLINENDRNLVNAISFIDQTKALDDKPTEEKIVPKLSEKDLRDKNNRIVVTTLLAVVALATVGTLGYVGYHLFILLF